MQSITRRQKRIESGLQNPAPSSTKIHPHTKAAKIGSSTCFRTNRFKANIPIFVRRSGKKVLIGFQLGKHKVDSDQNGYVDIDKFSTLLPNKKSFSNRIIDWFKNLVASLGLDRARGLKLSYQ